MLKKLGEFVLLGIGITAIIIGAGITIDLVADWYKSPSQRPF
jgi:hypothetical protein